MSTLGERPQSLSSRTLDSLTTTVLLFDSRLALSFINPAGEMLFAMSARKAMGLHLNGLVSGADHLERQLRLVLESSHPFTVRELHLHTTDGRDLTVDCTVTPLLEPERPPELLVELQQMDRHMRINREENLLTQNSAARDLVRGLAHEIKNPLGGLRGAAQLLERELHDEDLKEYTRIIIGEADRLQNLVDRMLGPSNVPQKRRINVHEVLEHVCSLVQAEGAADLRISRDYDPSIPDLMADPDMLVQAVLNIVRNAAQAMDNNGEMTLRTRTVRQFTIGHQRHKLVLRIDIIDNGPGIPEDMWEKIFYPMITGRADGTGLGLSIAQSLVNRHYGLIECASRPGRTKFTILIPLEPLDE